MSKFISLITGMTTMCQVLQVCAASQWILTEINKKLCRINKEQKEEFSCKG